MAARPFPLLTFLPPQGHGRTLFLAGSFLGLCALGQFGALAWYLAEGGTQHRVGGGPEASGGPANAAVLTAPLARETPPLALPQPTPLAANASPPTSPVAAVPPAQPPPAEAVSITGPAPVFTQPTPAPPAARNAGGVSSVAAELVEQAKTLRARGDTQSALARLREAQNVAGGADSPLVIAEMALTYEAMQMPDRANVQWNRLLELGESVGAPYYLAESRLRANGMPTGIDPDPSTAGAVDPAGTGRDRGGFQANALLRILKATVEEEADPEAERKHALRIVVKNRPGTAIDARKVRVEAQFYDLLDGKEIVQTDAETGYRWLTPPVDWANDSSEELETTYFRPKNGELALSTASPGSGAGSSSALLPPPPPPKAGSASSRHGNTRNRRTPSSPPAAAPTPALTLDVAPLTPARVYLGYIVRLYYNRQLQDVRADPADLLQHFPPVLTLPADQPIGQQ